MSEQAPVSIWAVAFFVELLAHLGLVLLVLLFLLADLHRAVRKLALAPVPAVAQLNPVLAQLRLVLRLVHLQQERLLLQRRLA